MARRPDGTDVVAAVQRIFRNGLLTGRSAFAPDLEAWTAEAASDLRARFVDRPDESSDTFLVKLGRQLAGLGRPICSGTRGAMFVSGYLSDDLSHDQPFPPPLIPAMRPPCRLTRR